MIDGFGWFEAADYRRSWLFFDEVHYILPKDTINKFGYSLQIYRSNEFSISYMLEDPEHTRELWSQALRNAENHTFRSLVLNKVPPEDLTYACRLVNADANLIELAKNSADTVVAISYLLEKLLAYSKQTGCLPIVGRRYAHELLIHRIATNPEIQDDLDVGLTSPEQSVAVPAFAAGLSLSFLSDQQLELADFSILRQFKTTNRPLLEKHQLHILEVAQRFNELPAGRDYQNELRLLRTDAMKKRIEMEEQAMEAWSGMGIALAKKAIESSTFLKTAVAVLSSGFSGGIAGATMTGMRVVASEAVTSYAKHHKAETSVIAYLFQAENLLS